MSRFNSTPGSLDSLSDMELPTFDGGDDPLDLTYPRPADSDDRNMSSQTAADEDRQTDETSPRPRRKKTRQQTMANQENKGDQSAEKTETQTSVVRRRGIFSRLFADGRARMFFGIVFIIAAIFLTLTSIGYLTTGENDQSAVTNNAIGTLADTAGSVENVGGPVGAWTSHAIFSSTLGVAGFIMIFYLAALGLMLLKVFKFKFWNLTAKCLVSTVAVSIILGLATYDHEGFIYWGGKHGYYINKLLIAYSGIVGAVSISVIMGALMLLLFLPSLQRGWKFVYDQVQKRTARIRQMKAEHAASRMVVPQPMEATQTYDGKIDTVDSGDVVDSNMSNVEAGNCTPSTIEQDHANYNPEAQSDDSVYDFPSNEDIPVTTYDEPMTDISTGVIKDSIDESDTAQWDKPESFSISTGEITIAKKVEQEPYDPTADLPRFHFPSIDCLIERKVKENNVDLAEQEENKERITKTLNDYGIGISHIEATVGPTVTLYEIIPAEGVRIAKIKRLEDDIALSLAALGIRIIAPIPGRGTIGIEVPNKEPQTVSMRSIITSRDYQECNMELPMAMGSTISGDVFIADLTKMPHLLVAGATGMGKSVGLNAIIASLLYKKHPAELKFVLIDPKMVEFSLYSRIEHHYLAKLPDEEDAIITDPSKVVTTLKSLCLLMDQRYALLKEANLRNIKEYNARFIQRRLNPEKGHHYMPYIVVIVDEFADLIMTAGKEVETPIARIAQKARAVGMHMILATQRPSTNVITGIIKANFPGRVAFRVTQMVDSRTILDRPGANQLIGRGDMLFSRDGEISRVQCAFIDTPEVEAICEEIDMQAGYEHAFYLPECLPEEGEAISAGSFGDRDPLFEEAAMAILSSGVASTSSLQRRFSIGYNRAGKIMDQMEAVGIVGPAQGGKPRQILIDAMSLDAILSQK